MVIHSLGNSKYYVSNIDNINDAKIHPNVKLSELNSYVRFYMAMYGIDNVRGGKYVTDKLDEYDREYLNSQIWAIKGNCYLCGYKVFEDYLEAKEHIKKCSTESYNIRNCFVCGKFEHFGSTCVVY